MHLDVQSRNKVLILFVLFVLISVESFHFDVVGLNLYIWQVLSVCFFFFGLAFIAIVKKNILFENNSIYVFLPVVLFLVVGNIDPIDARSSLKISVLLGLCFFLCSNIFFVLRFYSILEIFCALLLTYASMAVIGIVQFVLAFIGLITMPQFGDGVFGLGRVCGLFYESGWYASWLVWVSALIHFLASRVQISWKKLFFLDVIVFVVLYLTYARVGIFLHLIIVLFFFSKMNVGRIIVSLVIACFVVIILGVYVDIPVHFYDDLQNLDRNPRFVDFNIILNAMDIHKRHIFGFGIGTLEYLNNFIVWRKFGATHNVMPLSVFYEYGFFGLFSFFFLMYGFFCRLYKIEKYLAAIFALFILVNFFHSALYRGFFWLFLAILIDLSDRYGYDFKEV